MSNSASFYFFISPFILWLSEFIRYDWMESQFIFFCVTTLKQAYIILYILLITNLDKKKQMTITQLCQYICWSILMQLLVKCDICMMC